MSRPALICELAELLESIDPLAYDDMEREAMADSGLYQDIDPASPNYWQAMSRYTKAGRSYFKRNR